MRASIAAVLACLLAVTANAQRLSVRVHVVDTAGAPVEGAEVLVSHDLARILARGVTDAHGMRVLAIDRTEEDYDVTARRIGYRRADRYVAAPKADTIRVDIVLTPAPPTLEAMTVTAHEDVKRKSYYVDADEIANSSRLIMNGMDVLTKMKPDILTGRAPGCGVKEVWINGKRIVDPPVNELAEAHAPRVRGSWLAGTPNSVWSILWTIKPEHIQEMEYKDCMDTSMPGLHVSSALFIVLKPGVAYDPGRGTYVVGTPKRRATASKPSSPSYRFRVLGVFDEASGEPLAEAQVVDDSSGTTALTTATGTVTLAFLPEGASSITVRKTGYATKKLSVTISPADTAPITLILSKEPPTPR